MGQSIGSATDKATQQIDAAIFSKKWRINADGKSYTSSDGKTYNFGDEISNDEVLAATGGTKKSYTSKWQVMGVENGKLKLVSSR